MFVVTSVSEPITIVASSSYGPLELHVNLKSQEYTIINDTQNPFPSH